MSLIESSQILTYTCVSSSLALFPQSTHEKPGSRTFSYNINLYPKGKPSSHRHVQIINLPFTRSDFNHLQRSPDVFKHTHHQPPGTQLQVLSSMSRHRRTRNLLSSTLQPLLVPRMPVSRLLRSTHRKRCTNKMRRQLQHSTRTCFKSSTTSGVQTPAVQIARTRDTHTRTILLRQL